MISDKDLKIELYDPHAGGGMKVGYPTGVKITYLPQEVIAIVNIDRDQYRNKQIAMDMILSAITHPKYR